MGTGRPKAAKKKRAEAECSHEDALGYLNDLVKEVDEPWFSMVCDCAVGRGSCTLGQPDLNTLCNLIAGDTDYECVNPHFVDFTPPTPTAAVDFLEELSGFANFKLLEDTLRVAFDKRITLIFGSNGSGKSSVCEALEALASREVPSRPLQNVRGAANPEPSFSFKFKSDAVSQTWTPQTGYGLRSGAIKYFDSDIASRNITAAVEPGRLIELTPFKLQVFENVKNLTIQAREEFRRRQQSVADELAEVLEEVRLGFTDFIEHPLASVNETTTSILDAEIRVGQSFTERDYLKEKLAVVNELERATSDEGLRLLRAERSELESFLATITALVDACASLWELDSAGKTKLLEQKKVEQQALANALVPTGKSLDSLIGLLHAASGICDLDTAAEDCPLCKRKLESDQIELFHQYHDLLTGDLETEIGTLKLDIGKASRLVQELADIKTGEWEKYTTLPVEAASRAKAVFAEVMAGVCMDKRPSQQAKDSLETMRGIKGELERQHERKNSVIKTAEGSKGEAVSRLVALRRELEPLRYADCVRQHLPLLLEANKKASEHSVWTARIDAIPQVLRRITETTKTAHDKLVVKDFESRLDAEYKSLSEKNMAAFGVALKRTGNEASVMVTPHIGGRGIDDVLSEGELRVHALALFFAELDTCSQSVLIFDDPISSFDFNYIDNYCSRLRDYSIAHPNQQIIVLTHNWEFFVNLQTTLNRGRLDSHLSVQVMENCATIAAYSEKVGELETDIEGLLAQPGEPTKARKGELAGMMRRLIEAIVNTYVFNSQRQQYKQRSQAVSVFHEYTRIVPLEQSEATKLGDLFSRLSISEHDDPRNAYVNTDKATFQSRYDEIRAVEDAVKARR